MKAARTIQGQWSIFGDKEGPAVGPLRFDPDTGLTLDVQRHRAPNIAQALTGFSFVPPKVIRGIDAHGTPVTLFGCALLRSEAAAALDEYSISSVCAIIGAHCNEFDDAMYSSISASYSILDEWLTRSGIEIVKREPGLPAYALQLQPDIAITLPDLTVAVLRMFPTPQVRPKSITLTQSQFILFRTVDPVPLRTLIDNYVITFCKFLSFVSGTDVFVDQVVVPGTNSAGTVEWLCGMRGRTQAKRTLHPEEPLVSYQEIATDLPRFIADWFTYYERMGAILNLYFTAVSKSDIPGDTRFLLLAQALEAYHGRSDRFTGGVQLTAEFRDRCKTLIGGAPPAEQAWLREKLSFANQKTLAVRLNELIADQQGHVAKFVNDTTLFANTIRWTRNYYTHFGEAEEERVDRGQGRIAQGAEIIAYTRKMQALLELLFITDLHLPNSAINQVSRRAAQFYVFGA